ncbi:hypothetical protein P280DRAFT_516350 [Massarina eburnea CBS 473.64]|uniref:FAD linked oxidase N-terminal domain-containing protein n=1 Tax=Massarina eburnea CBS 473.64 TaxID=1395130 RepID=A0A6A6S5W6_9PLEO|nr:hypothetical protein P280DRAFT_516350 [Massarina eburnea CBS 473.64]
MLQAKHGSALDNIVSARVVLYKGTVITASATSNLDLFWALRGAGHNTGIVASMQLKMSATYVGYVALYTVTQNNIDNTNCRANMKVMSSGASLLEWNATSARTAYNVFTEMIADPRFKTSVLLLENYGMQGVKAIIDAVST